MIYYVKQIIDNKKNKLLLNQYIDFDYFNQDIDKRKVSQTSFLSSSRIGTVTEQFLILNQYKNLEDNYLEDVVNKFKENLVSLKKSILTKKYSGPNTYAGSGNPFGDNTKLHFFNTDEDLSENSLYNFAFKNGMINTVLPYTFIENNERYKFQTYLSKTYFMNLKVLSNFFDECYK